MVSGFEDNLPDGWAVPLDVDLFPSGDQWTAEAVYLDEAIEGLYVLISNTDTL